MLNKQRLIQSFEEIIGWPYASPGSNDDRGLDCSGAFVRAYRQQGSSIYHGSNTILRKHCKTTGKITSTNDLQAGMAVFKVRYDGNEPAKYKNDGLGNAYHIGLVVNVNPLEVIHATTPVAKRDTSFTIPPKKTNQWSVWGMLAEVDYDSYVPQPQPVEPQKPTPPVKPANPGKKYPTLRQGAKSDEVITLQKALIKANYRGSNIEPDGVFGKGTDKAVKYFQEAHKLTADGVVGTKTWLALEPFIENTGPKDDEPGGQDLNPIEDHGMTYSVTILNVTKSELDAIMQRWPDSIIGNG